MKNLLVVLMAALLLGCNKNDNPVSSDNGNGTPLGAGSITGSVTIHREPSDLNAVDNSGVTVTIEGTKLSAVSDINGAWTIKGLNDGTITVVLSKSSYGVFKKPNLKYTIGVNDYDGGAVTLFKLPTSYFTDLYIRSGLTGVAGIPSTFHTIITISAITAGAKSTVDHYSMRVFASANSDVSCDPSKYTMTYAKPVDILGPSIVIDSVTFNKAGFISGQQVYVAAYVEGSSPSNYTDQTTGKQVYPVLNPTISKVVQVKVP
jgi:hypothetical protein